MMTVKIQTNYPDGSTHTLVRECERVYYTEKWYNEKDNTGHNVQMGELINPNGESAQAAWCVYVHIINENLRLNEGEEAIVLCLPESWIYILQNGKTIDTVRATFIQRKE